MSFTLTQLDAIEKAIGTGELTVIYDGVTVTYRSVAELKHARELIRADLQASGLLAQKPRTSYAMRVRN
jgi:hypothetical protein